jgi:dienelactone hydrolase
MLAVAGFAILACSQGLRADEVVTLPTRAGVTQSYFLLPARDRTAVVALMFPGGYGQIHLPTDGSLPQYGHVANFLVRARELFRDNEVGVALLDAPSDHQAGGLTDGMRMSAEHVEDVRTVVRDLKKRFPGAKVMLVGTSRGTLSVAYVARALGGEIDGAVETSSLFAGGGRAGPGSLGAFDWSSIKVPLLFVHHGEDGCRSCPYAGAKSMAERYPLITVHGGLPPESDPCEAMSAHGYLGKEAETAAAIKLWMLGRPHPAVVE